MNIALWNHPALDLLASALTELRDAHGLDVTLERHAPVRCADLLRDEEVDIALVPTLDVMRTPGDFDILPAVAFSTWSNPFARIVLKHAMGGMLREIAYDPDYELEQFVARIILREHYRWEPVFVPHQGTAQELLEGEEDAALLVSPHVTTEQLGDSVLDLGQEWYELANYPMVWGLFVAREDTAIPAVIHLLREAAKLAEQERPAWLEQQELSAVEDAFVRNDLRFRLDDLVIASLTEFRQYMFYFGVSGDIPNLEFVSLPDEEDEEDSPQPLL